MDLEISTVLLARHNERYRMLSVEEKIYEPEMLVLIFFIEYEVSTFKLLFVNHCRFYPILPTILPRTMYFDPRHDPKFLV